MTCKVYHYRRSAHVHVMRMIALSAHIFRNSTKTTLEFLVLVLVWPLKLHQKE